MQNRLTDPRRDALGRLRRSGQERGLAPRHPRLPSGHASRSVRVAMSAADWRRFEELVRRAAAAGEPTDARAHGAVIAGLMRAVLGDAPLPEASAAHSSAEWLDWELERHRRATGLVA